MATKSLRLGRRVEYTSGDGFKKLGFVTATAETVKSGTAVPVPGEGEAHILVVPPTGNQYHRTSVRQGEGPRTFRIL